MNRADFFKSFFKENQENLAGIEVNTNPLSAKQVAHLLRRTTFGISPAVTKTLIGKTAIQVVDLLLNNAVQNPQPTLPVWKDTAYKNPERKPPADRQKAYDEIYSQLYKENYDLVYWWMEKMQQDRLSIREKMTLFWHGHFTTKFSIDGIMPAQSMLKQNQFLRANHQGNFRTLMKGVTLDGAMLIFLNGQDSTGKSPNENYSRELLELYTMGIGHYTENDVQEGARILTGWRTNYYEDEYTNIGTHKPFFSIDRHDGGAKTYFGETIPPTSDNTDAAIIKNEIDPMMDIILRKKGDEVANFICEKLYKYFVYSNPSPSANASNIIKEMAMTFKKNNFEIKPVLKQLLTSQHFFDDTTIGIQLKTPAELVVGLTSHFNVKYDWASWVMSTMGQELLNPPNVAGWPGYRKWVNTRTFPFAVQQAGYFVFNQTDDQLIKWIAQFDTYEDPRKLTKQICETFLAKEVSENQLNKYVKTLMEGSPEYEWYEILKTPSNAGRKLKYLFVQLVKSPDFHLC